MSKSFSTRVAAYRRLLEATRYRVLKTLRDANQVVTLVPPGPVQGSVLLSYVIEPFLLKPGQPVPHGHSNFTESLEMAQTFLERGFRVEIIDSKNDLYHPTANDYAFFIPFRV